MSSPTDLPSSPYKGLVPYSEQDAAFFFGREREQSTITANLMGRRLTVLYGPTGAGKSSVLRAGVAYQLRQYALQNADEQVEPELAIIVYDNWRDDPVTGLAIAIQREMEQATAAGAAPQAGPSVPLMLIPSLEAWSRRFKSDLLIILDQFEEFFLYHAQAGGEGSFAVEFPLVVNRPNLRVNLLVSLREDALSKLDRFKGSIPNLFDNYLRIGRLTREAARDAVLKPLEAYNRQQPEGSQPVAIEPELVEAVLDQVQTGRVTLARDGRAVVNASEPSAEGGTVETAYLQLVMTRLWNEEMGQGSRRLRTETLARLKGAQNIVRTHLDTVMAGLAPEERDTATQVLRFLVTPSGTKIAYTLRDLAAYTNLPAEQLVPVLERLASSGLRILRTVEPLPGQPQETRYEVFHDMLAPAVLDWCARFVQEQEKRRLEQRLVLAAEAQRQALLRLQEQHELDDARKLAESERRRAEEQAQAANRLRYRNRLMTILGLVALAAAIFAALLGYQSSRNATAAQVANTASALNLATAQVANAASALNLARAQAASTSAYQQAETAQANEATARAASTQAANSADQASTSAAIARNSLATAQAATPAPAVDATGTAAANQDQQNRTRSVQLAAQSASLLPTQPALALLLAVEAYNIFNTEEATNALLAGLKISQTWSAELIGAPITFNGRVYALAFSPDGQTLAAGTDAGEVAVEQVSSQQPVQYRNDQPGRVMAVAFSPDGQHLAVGSDVGAVNNLWSVADLTRGKPLASIGEPDNWILSLGFKPDDSNILAYGRVGSTIIVWDVARGHTARTLSGHRDDVWSVAWSPDGKVLASGSADGTVRTWDPSTGAPRLTLRGHTDLVRSVAWSPDGRLLASGSRDNSIILWDTTTGQMLAQLKGHTDEVRSVAFSPDGKLLASGSADHMIILWDVANRALIAQLKGHAHFVVSVAFSPDGQTLASGSYDRTVRFWNVAGGQRTDQPLTTQACALARRNLTQAEWTQFFSGQTYHQTCQQYPPGV